MVPTDPIAASSQRSSPAEGVVTTISRPVSSGSGPERGIQQVGSPDGATQFNVDTTHVKAPSPTELNDELEAIVKSLNEQLADSGRQLGFRIDSVMNRPVVTVTNQSTGEVVRQIPTEVVIRVAHSIEALKGLIFDQAT